MTTMTATPTTAHTPVAAWGVGSAFVATCFTVFGAHHWLEIGVIVGAVVVCAAIVFGFVVPRALRRESAGGTSLGLSILALVLLFPAFWAGVPLVLGVAGALVGASGRQARTGSTSSIVGLALGALAAIGYVTIYIFDALNGGAGFLFD